MFYLETQRKREENDKIVVKRKLEMEGLEHNLDKRKEGFSLFSFVERKG